MDVDGDGGGGGPATGARAGRVRVPDRRRPALRESRFSVLPSLEDDSAEECGVGDHPELEEYMDDLVRPGSAAFPCDRKWWASSSLHFSFPLSPLQWGRGGDRASTPLHTDT